MKRKRSLPLRPSERPRNVYEPNSEPAQARTVSLKIETAQYLYNTRMKKFSKAQEIREICREEEEGSGTACDGTDQERISYEEGGRMGWRK